MPAKGAFPIADHLTSSHARPSVAIIGGGVIGLGIGWRLAEAGCRVDLFDRAAAGRGASWAAAGMLAAGIETEPGELALHALNRASQRRWPDFARSLEAAGGIALGYRAEGTLRIALTRDDAARLRASYEYQSRNGIALDWLTGAEARRREPHLATGVSAGVFSAHDHQVDNRCVVAALLAAFRRAGGGLHEHAAIERVEVANGRAIGVRVGGSSVPADIVVLAAGAWSRDIDGLPEAVRPPVRPVKGQMLALQMDPTAPLLRHVLWTPKAYLVPREDGRLIVGASVEERGFDPALTAGATLALLEAAWRALPGCEELPIAEMWAGFRPGSRDDAPILGACAVDGLILATGHHRNGILLTPITVETIMHLILTGESDPAIAPFCADRFGAATLTRETA